MCFNDIYRQKRNLIAGSENSSDELVRIKKNIVYMTHYSHASHVGSALSCVDLLYVIYSRIVNITVENLASIDRDKVILSKGHASVALYSVLAELGFLDKDALKYYYIDDGVLPGHLDKDVCKGVDCSAGSLGHGLSIGIGMALAKPEHKVFVVMGDGESEEGAVWEGLIFCGKRALPNLTIIIDNNNLQGFGRVDEIADFSKLSEALRYLGCDTYDIDGHDLTQIEDVLRKETRKTKVVVAHTIKGKGVSFMENEFKWHYKSPNDVELEIALQDLEK